MTLYLIILAIVSLIVLALAIKTNLLRDAVTDITFFTAFAAQNNIKNPKPTFSLARVQLAFWTVIIFSSFTYLLFKFHFQVPDFANVNLILLGIAVAATASGKLIDDTQQQGANANLAAPPIQSFPSEGFLRDILSDKGGVSIHRLQNVLWTLVVGIIYMHFVATAGSLPDETVLTNNLLILMGISTGTYVGLKTMENK